MRSISEIEKEEFEVVDRLSRALPSGKRAGLIRRREELRVEKAALLAKLPNVLRKSAEDKPMQTDLVKAIAEAIRRVQKEPAVKDRPNAESPDAALGDEAKPQNQFEAAWVAPSNIRGQSIHTSAGMMRIPRHGVVMTRAPIGHNEKSCQCVDCGLHRELAGRGFRRQQAKKAGAELALDQIKALHAAGAQKSAVISAILRRDPSRELAAKTTPNDNDFLRWLGDRAAKASGEPVPSEPARSPRDHYRARLIAAGYSPEYADQVIGAPQPTA
jgi:hypothetical protein